MGTILLSYGDAGYDHEGYPAQVLDDGTLTGTYSPETRPRMVGQLVAACDCGWTGTTRYPCAEGDPLDEDAEALALQEWERIHVRPVPETAQRDELTGLQTRLRGLAGLFDLTSTWSPWQRVDQLDRLCAALHSALAVAERLRDQADEQAERSTSPDDSGKD